MQYDVNFSARLHSSSPSVARYSVACLAADGSTYTAASTAALAAAGGIPAGLFLDDSGPLGVSSIQVSGICPKAMSSGLVSVGTVGAVGPNAGGVLALGGTPTIGSVDSFGNVYLVKPSTVVQIDGSAGVATVAAAGLFWLPNTTGAVISQQPRTSDLAAQDFIIRAQAPWSSAVSNLSSGNLNLGTSAPIGGGTTGAINLQPGASTCIQVVADTAQGAAGAIVFGTTPATTGILRIPYTAGAQVILARRDSGNANDLSILSSNGNNAIFGDPNFVIADLYGFNIGIIAGGSVFYQAAGAHVFCIGNGIETMRYTPVNGGANVMQFATGNTSNTISQADNTSSSATGATMKLQAQNATGTAAFGGELQLGPGTGTSTNGKLNLINMITGTTVGAAGAGSALPATPAGYMNIKINGTAQRVPYYA